MNHLRCEGESFCQYLYVNNTSILTSTDVVTRAYTHNMNTQAHTLSSWFVSDDHDGSPHTGHHLHSDVTLRHPTQILSVKLSVEWRWRLEAASRSQRRLNGNLSDRICWRSRLFVAHIFQIFLDGRWAAQHWLLRAGSVYVVHTYIHGMERGRLHIALTPDGLQTSHQEGCALGA